MVKLHSKLDPPTHSQTNSSKPCNHRLHTFQYFMPNVPLYPQKIFNFSQKSLLFHKKSCSYKFIKIVDYKSDEKLILIAFCINSFLT